MNINILNFAIMGDCRGSLIALEENKNIPFPIRRVYYIFDTKSDVIRGRHAHKSLTQILICVSGQCKILLDNGKETEIIVLDSPDKGLEINGLIWREMFDFSSDCVLMVLASEKYDECDYIRNYNDFLELVKFKIKSEFLM